VTTESTEPLIRAAQLGDAGACAKVDALASAGEIPWELQRRTGIGGSDWAVALGLSPYSSPVELQQRLLGHLPPIAENDAMRWGNIHEASIARWYAERHGVDLEPVPRSMRSDERCWHMYSPDRVVVRDPDLPALGDNIERIVEIKSHSGRMRGKYGDDDTDSVPYPYLVQVVCYQAGLQVQLADVAVLFDTSDYREFRIERDIGLESEIVDRLAQWWQRHIVEQLPVDPDGSDSYGRWLRHRYPATTGQIVAPSQRVLEWASTLRQVEQYRRQLDSARELLIQHIAAELGDDAGFDLGDGCRITFRHDKRGRVNHSAVAEELAVRLGMGPRQLKALQDQHLGKPPRRWLSPRRWSTEPLPVVDLDPVSLLVAAYTDSTGEQDDGKRHD